MAVPLDISKLILSFLSAGSPEEAILLGIQIMKNTGGTQLDFELVNSKTLKRIHPVWDVSCWLEYTWGKCYFCIMWSNDDCPDGCISENCYQTFDFRVRVTETCIPNFIDVTPRRVDLPREIVMRPTVISGGPYDMQHRLDISQDQILSTQFL